MHRRRITRALGAAAGGLLGAMFLPVAFAFADDYDIVGPDGPETVTGLYGFDFGFDTTPPAVNGSVDGTHLFDYTDTTTGASGTFTADESTSTDGFGDTNQELLVTSDGSSTDAPPVGSVFDTYTFGDGGFENIYSDIVGAGTNGANEITDTLVTPFGDFTIPDTMNAASIPVADSGGVATGDGDDIDPTGTETITAINGISPLTVVDLGTQQFEVTDDGTQVGTFTADEATSTDGLGTVTQTVLVTSDDGATNVGTAAGDVPAVGSVFNTVSLGGDQLIYSDLASPSGDVITDTLVTPFGDFDIPTTFDATAEILEANAASIGMGDGYDIVVDPGNGELTGVNGLPPIDVAFEGAETFDVDNSSGSSLGSFDGDVTTTADAFGNTTQTILVTSDGSTDTVGTADGDIPAVGSEFDTVTFGGTGFELIYSELAGATSSADVVTETLVTPLGDITVPTDFDAAAALATDILSAG
jgi:hypothetical protein